MAERELMISAESRATRLDEFVDPTFEARAGPEIFGSPAAT